MIRNIVFDMGQVLIRWRPEEILEHFDLTGEEKTMLLQELFRSPEWIAQDHGIITEADMIARVNARLPETLHGTVGEVIKAWYVWHLTPMPGMAALVRELKEKGYGIYLLSNASTALRGYFPRIPGSEYFDGLMVSAEEKLLKPQHEIYERLYERFGLVPEQCVFIDDSPANIEGAMLTGMQGIVFRGDTERLRRELKALGITV